MEKNKIKNIKKKKILITGASGFIGFYLSEYAHKKGYLLFGIDINEPKNPEIWKNFYVNKLDKKTIESLMNQNEFDAIYHLAGSASVPLSFESPFSDFDSLIPPTLLLLDGIRKFSVNTKLIIFSSAAVYGNPEKLPILENIPKKPISPYGLHKSINEDIIEFYSNLYKIECSVLRIFSAYGEGLRKQLFWDIMNKYKRNNKQIEVYGTGNESRDFIHVKDVVRLAMLVGNKNLNSYFNVFNVANGIEITIKQCLDYLFLNANIKPEIVFQGQQMQGTPVNWKADVSKIKEIGYISKHDIKLELTNYFNWFSKINE
ncbi:NAD(P)-dependent oxidoreductase [bacterium]|nr:NAD(P)-dependent oxidoreductase [bacterium]